QTVLKDVGVGLVVKYGSTALVCDPSDPYGWIPVVGIVSAANQFSSRCMNAADTLEDLGKALRILIQAKFDAQAKLKQIQDQMKQIASEIEDLKRQWASAQSTLDDCKGTVKADCMTGMWW